MRLETSKLVYDNCRPGAPVASVVEEKASKNDQQANKAQSSKVVATTVADTSETEYHKFNCFYQPSLLTRPEFVFQNQIVALKDSDVALLEAALV